MKSILQHTLTDEIMLKIVSWDKNTTNTIYVTLSQSLFDGKWHTVTKDMQADLSAAQPGTTINKVLSMQTWWGGKMDNIKLLKSMPTTGTPTSKTIYHHLDHLSGANIETAESGNIIETTDYYPFGEIRTDQTTTAYKNPYKFTGKELDTDTGLYYYGARYYNATIGRFISQDPWGGDLANPQSLNKYSYVLNNPLKYTDPSGKSWYNPLSWDWGEIGSNLAESVLDTLDSIPITGDLSDVYAVHTSKRLFSQDDLSQEELDFTAAVAILPFITGGMGKMADEGYEASGKVVNITTDITKKIKNVFLKNEDKIGKFSFTKHAIEQMQERNVSLTQVSKILNNKKPFKYFHEGISKTGFFDKSEKTFVGTVGNKILTVINNVKEKYINNLKKH